MARLDDAYRQYLLNWDWEWYATLTFPEEYRNRGESVVSRRLKAWTRQLCVREGIQVAYYYLLCFKDGHPHLHLLMLGRSSTPGYSLRDVGEWDYEAVWPFHAKIEHISIGADVVGYVVKHLIGVKCDDVVLDSYNQKLLGRTMGIHLRNHL